MEARLAVVSLWAEDVPATAHFYRDVLGLRLLPQHGDRPNFDLGGVYLTIWKRVGAGPGVPLRSVIYTPPRSKWGRSP